MVIGIKEAKLAGFKLCVYLSSPNIARYPAYWTNSMSDAEAYVVLALSRKPEVFDLYQRVNDRIAYQLLETLCTEMKDEVERESRKEGQPSHW